MMEVGVGCRIMGRRKITSESTIGRGNDGDPFSSFLTSSFFRLLGRADIIKLESGKDDVQREDFWQTLGTSAPREGIQDASKGELTPELEAVFKLPIFGRLLGY